MPEARGGARARAALLHARARAACAHAPRPPQKRQRVAAHAVRALLVFALAAAPRLARSAAGGDQDRPGCNDVSEGRWVKATRKVPYDPAKCGVEPSHRCATLPLRAREAMASWNWAPTTCGSQQHGLPPATAEAFADALGPRRRLVLVGDSLQRNLHASMRCLSGLPSSRRVFFQCPYLARSYHQKSGKHGASATVALGEAASWEKHLCPDDVLVLGGGHWYQHTGNTYVPATSDVDAPVEAVRGLRARLEARGFEGVVLWRTFSPKHFKGGDWDDGGSCGGETYNGTAPPWSPKTFHEALVAERMAAAWSGTSLRHFALFNITGASRLRHDAHPGSHGLSRVGGRKVMDCSHWCLPGVPDAWQAMLLALLRGSKLAGSRLLHGGNSTCAPPAKSGGAASHGRRVARPGVHRGASVAAHAKARARARSQGAKAKAMAIKSRRRAKKAKEPRRGL